MTTTKLITVAAIAGMVGACTPAPAEHRAPASCEGKCDFAGQEEVPELLYGERREVGPVGDFGIQADWTEVVAIEVEPESRAQLVIEPLGSGAMPELTIYRDLGTSVEWVAESDAGVLEVEGVGAEERYVVEVYGPPSATEGAILELACVAGTCGPAVEVSVTEQPLRDTPTELAEAAGDAWSLFRVGASRESAEALKLERVVERVALTAEAAEAVAREAGEGELAVQGAPEIELSEVGAYAGGEEALDAFADFLDPEGSRYAPRFGEAGVVYELAGPGGETARVYQQIPVLLLVSDSADDDLAVALDRRAVL